MGIPYVKTFCCVRSLKLGAIIIAYISQIFSFIGFVVVVSHGYMMYRRVRSQGVEENNVKLIIVLSWTYTAIGIVLVVLQLLFGCSLYTGIRKDDARYVKACIVMGYLSILLAISTSIIGPFVTVFTIIYPLTIAIPVQMYFLLVLRSVVKEMSESDDQSGTAYQNRQEHRGGFQEV